MNTIPAEILLEIGKTDLATYRGMLAIPKFALAVTIGYRLDRMVDTGYNFNHNISFHRTRLGGICIRRIRGNKAYVLSIKHEISIYIYDRDEIRFHYRPIGGGMFMQKNTLNSHNDGDRLSSLTKKCIDRYGYARQYYTDIDNI